MNNPVLCVHTQVAIYSSQIRRKGFVIYIGTWFAELLISKRSNTITRLCLKRLVALVCGVSLSIVHKLARTLHKLPNVCFLKGSHRSPFPTNDWPKPEVADMYYRAAFATCRDARQSFPNTCSEHQYRDIRFTIRPGKG